MRESPSIKKKATRGKQEKHGHVTGEARACGEAEARAAGQKSGTAVPLSAARFSRYNFGFSSLTRGGSFGWGFVTLLTRVSPSFSQTPLGGIKVG